MKIPAWLVITLSLLSGAAVPVGSVLAATTVWDKQVVAAAVIGGIVGAAGALKLLMTDKDAATPETKP